MDAKIDPNVVVDLSIFKIGGWNSVQLGYLNLLEEFVDENEPWWLIGIPNRDPFLVTQYLERHFASSDQHVKESMPLRESLHVMVQCYKRQHFAVCYWLCEDLVFKTLSHRVFFSHICTKFHPCSHALAWLEVLLDVYS